MKRENCFSGNYDSGRKKYETESLNYNYKTNKAIAYNTRTEESEGAIVANKTKKRMILYII